MAYTARTNSPRQHRHDPSSRGIFIHGGTCLMHGPRDPFAASASPNRFSLTFPLVKGHRLPSLPEAIASAPTFQLALARAKEIRASIPDLGRAPIFACTDLIQQTSYMGHHEVQQVA